MPRFELQIIVELHVNNMTRFIVEAENEEAARNIAFDAIDGGEHDDAVYPAETVGDDEPGLPISWHLGEHWTDDNREIDVDVIPLDE